MNRLPPARPNGPPMVSVDPDTPTPADETVRRQVATQLLSGLLASGYYLAEFRPPRRELAIDAVKLADALLERLEEEKEK